MKKNIFFTATVVFALILSSCKKDYTCTCKSSDPSITSIDSQPLGKQTKKKAKEACSLYQSQVQMVDETATCSID